MEDARHCSVLYIHMQVLCGWNAIDTFYGVTKIDILRSLCVNEPEKTSVYTDKKENQIFLTYKEIQNGAVAKSYMTNGLLIYGEIFAHFLIY